MGNIQYFRKLLPLQFVFHAHVRAYIGLFQQSRHKDQYVEVHGPQIPDTSAAVHSSFNTGAYCRMADAVHKNRSHAAFYAGIQSKGDAEHLYQRRDNHNRTAHVVRTYVICCSDSLRLYEEAVCQPLEQQDNGHSVYYPQHCSSMVRKGS